MVAKNLLFEKVFNLPVSRWTALRDKVINIPNINVMETLEKLPRLPSKAGLLLVKLKRRLGYSSVHRQGLIDVFKLYQALRTFKALGNPFYEVVDENLDLLSDVRENDPEIYDILFGTDSQVDEIVDGRCWIRHLCA